MSRSICSPAIPFPGTCLQVDGSACIPFIPKAALIVTALDLLAHTYSRSQAIASQVILPNSCQTGNYSII